VKETRVPRGEPCETLRERNAFNRRKSRGAVLYDASTRLRQPPHFGMKLPRKRDARPQRKAAEAGRKLSRG